MSKIAYNIRKYFKGETLEDKSKVDLTIGILINKLNRDSLNSLINKLRNYLYKLDALYFDVLEVNTFLFINCGFPLEFAELIEQRTAVVKNIEQIMHNYCSKECSLYAKTIRQNIEIKDITKMLVQLVKDSKTLKPKNIIQEIENQANDIDDRVVHHVSDVLLNSFIAVWDFPENIPDIIMFPDLFLKRDVSDKKNNVPLRYLAENLLIIQFGKACVNNLSPILSSLEKAIDSLESLLGNKKIMDELLTHMSNKLWRTLRVVFGLLSSTQQTITVLEKQIHRISEVRQDLVEQVRKLEYNPLMDYLMLMDTTLACDEYTSRLGNLQKRVKETYQALLDIINKFQDIPDSVISEDVSDIIDIFTKTLTEIQLMKFYSDKFKDLAYFQTIPANIVLEKQEEIDITEDVILKGISLFKTYRLLGSTVYALRGVDVEIKKGEIIAITGPSGSGKTTLLNLLSGLDTPTRGAVFLSGKNIDVLSDAELSIFRRKNMGFIFQYYNLIPQLTVLENVMLPGLMVKRPNREVRKKALELLEEVGLTRFQNQFPIKLSGGQMQRVTIARAMINDPAVLFADEPTGDLDSETGKTVIELIRRFAKEKQTAVILVTHDKSITKVCDRTIEIGDGRVVSN